jgi:hypothetical protein
LNGCLGCGAEEVAVNKSSVLSNDANKPAAPACWVPLGLLSLLNAILLDGNGGVYSGGV